MIDMRVRGHSIRDCANVNARCVSGITAGQHAKASVRRTERRHEVPEPLLNAGRRKKGGQGFGWQEVEGRSRS
jgi:hypothetical protein